MSEIAHHKHHRHAASLRFLKTLTQHYNYCNPALGIVSFSYFLWLFLNKNESTSRQLLIILHIARSPTTALMTSNAADEATHFSGSALSLESPVPIHIPEPSSNIPVLRNQTDPVFNLTSTHLQPMLTIAEADMAAFQTSTESLNGARPEAGLAISDSTDNNFISFEGNQEIDAEGDDDSAISYGDEKTTDQQEKEPEATDTLHNHSSSAAPPSTSAAHHDSLSTLPADETSTLYATLSQAPVKEVFAGPTEPSQNSSPTNEQVPPNHEPTKNAETYAQNPEQTVKDEGVNYETLLESLSPPTSTAPSAEIIASSTTAIPAESSVDHRLSSAEQSFSAIPLPAGLPPRPPPQEKPAIHPNYNAENDISTFHFPQGQKPNAHSSHTPQPSNPYLPPQGFSHTVSTPKVSVGANGLPPPPLATFQQSSSQADQVQPSPLTSQAHHPDGKKDNSVEQSVEEDDDEVPWTPEIERLWTEFLKEEAVYVNEGLWDRFPQGSRLFVGMMISPNSVDFRFPIIPLITCTGNLFSEKVTKRDLFRIFHKYGRLAQISIKNAYGFIQYLDAACCRRALQDEQGVAARGRKMRGSHRESKYLQCIK